MSKKKIPFTRLSSNFEVILPKDLEALKGGNSDEGEPVELPEVVVIGHPNEDEEEEEEPMDPDPDEPIDTNPDPDDPDFEYPPDGDTGDGSEEQQDDEQDPSDCNLTYAGMPKGDGNSDKQVGNTCATTVFSVLDRMITGQAADLNAVLDEIAADTAQKNGTSPVVEKFNLIQYGISTEQANAYLDKNYVNSDITVSYQNVQSSIQDGKTVYAHLSTGQVDNGVAIAHAVMITGVTSNGEVKYFDPQTGTYETTKDFAKFIYGAEIDLNQEPSVECN